MYCYAYDACMYDTKIRNDMLCSKMPDRLWLNAYTMNLEEHWKKESPLQSPISNPIFPFCKFFCWVTLFRSSFIQTYIFLKENIFSFSTSSFFFNNTFLFLTCHFFYHFSFDTLKYFFEENEYNTHFFRFFIFLFKIKYHPIPRK